MNHPYKYIGCFVPFQELYDKVNCIRKEPLPKTIRDPHVTFAYMPRTVDETLFGEEMTIKMIGYGNDGRNEGVKVELSADNPVLKEMMKRIEVPHITLAVSEEGAPVDTGKLHFEPIEPIMIVGKFGGFIECGSVITSRCQVMG
ncbi:MAG: hypothetical protein Q4C58_08315 [Eubacteriales bacterium]|nr:hypothetical protein [Eubacteriales bacterium]